MKPNEMLSQEEIDALLSAVKSGTVAVSPGGDRADAKAVIYNFRRPSRVSKEQIRALQILHEDFAKVTTASLSGMLRTMVDLELEAVEQISYSEYQLAIASPTCWLTRNVPSVFVSKCIRTSAAVTSSSRLLFQTAAQFTRTSSRPKCSMVC